MTSRLSSLLVQDGLVSAKRMADAFQRQVIYGGTLDTNLLEMRVVEEDVLVTYLGRASGLPTQPAGIGAMGKPTEEVLKAFPPDVAERFRAVPAQSIEGGVLRVLVSDPVEPQDMEALAQAVRWRIEPWIAPEFRLIEAMEAVYGVAMAPRFMRLLSRSKQSHEGKELPTPRLIDPVPRFGNLYEFRLDGSMPKIPASAIAQLLTQEDRPAEAAPGEEPAEEPVDEAAVVQERPAERSLPPARTEPIPELIPEQSAPVVPVKIAHHPPPAPQPRYREQTTSSVWRELLEGPDGEAPAPVAVHAGPVAEQKERPAQAAVPQAVPPQVVARIITKPEARAEARPETGPDAEQEAGPGAAPAAQPEARPEARPVEPAAAPSAQTLQPAAGGGRRKKKRRGEAPRVPPPAPIIAKPLITPPRTQPEPAPPVEPVAVEHTPKVPRPVAEPKVVIEASATSDLGEVRARVPSGAVEALAARPKATSEHTPLPPPMPPPTELSGPQPTAVSAATPPMATDKAAESIPVPIDSGRLGEQIIHGHPGTKVPTPAARDLPRVAVAIGEARPVPLSFTAAREIIAKADERDVIFEALCRAVRSRAAFAAVFTVHGDVAFGRTALQDEWLDRQGLGKVAVPLDRPSAFRIAVKGRAPYVGRLGDQPAVGEPLAAIGRKPPLYGAVMPVLVRGRPVALLYLDDGGRELKPALIEELKPLVVEVSQAFQRLVLRSRAGGFSDAVKEEARERKGQVQEEMIAPNTSSWRQPEPREPGRRPSGEMPRVVEVRDEAPAQKPEAEAARQPGDRAAPRASTEQPTTRLRVDGARKGLTESRPDIDVGPAGAPPQPLDQSGWGPRGSGPSPLGSAPEGPAAEAPAAVAARSPERVPERPGERPAEPAPARKIEAPVPAREDRRPAAAQTLDDLVKAVAGGDDKATATLLARGAEAAQAVVTALPGPLKSRERQALGDPIGQPVFARGPLLRLVPHLGMDAVAALLDRLKDPETPKDARYYLALSFTELPAEVAIQPLGQLLFDSDDAVRMAAVTALRACPAGAHKRELLETLRSELLGPDTRRQLHAADAIGELRDVMAVPRLIQLLPHNDLLLSDSAAKALQTIAKQDFGRSRWRWRMWWQRHQQEDRLQWMLAGLSHPSSAIRASAQDELRSLAGDVSGYRFDLPRREREHAQKRWAQWWRHRGFAVHIP